MPKKNNKDPFAALIAIAQHSLTTAKGLPAQVNITPHWSGIGFSVQGKEVVVPMGEVVEMLEVPNTTRIPGVQPWVVGVANVRGRLLPLFDIEAYFGDHLSMDKRRHRVLVIEIGELYTGIIVNEVFGMQHFPVDTFTDKVTEGTEQLEAYLSGAYVNEESSWLVFSPFNLVRDVRFFNAAIAV